MSRTKDFYWDEICAMPDPPSVNEPPFDDDLAPGEQEYWETIHRQIDECLIIAGRMDKTIDLMAEIANAVGQPTGKRHKYADMVIPF